MSMSLNNELHTDSVDKLTKEFISDYLIPRGWKTESYGEDGISYINPEMSTHHVTIKKDDRFYYASVPMKGSDYNFGAKFPTLYEAIMFAHMHIIYYYDIKIEE